MIIFLLTLVLMGSAQERQWVADSQMSLSEARVRISADDCPFGGGTCFIENDHRGGTIYLASDYGWSVAERKHILYHELGHAYDVRHLDSRERRAFMRAVGLRCSGWYSESCRTPIPAEVFAEQYAACAAGHERSKVPKEPTTPGGDWQFYQWTPPPSVDERALCNFIRRWA